MKTYGASWSLLLKGSSAALVALAIAIGVGMSFLPDGVPEWVRASAVWSFPLILLACLPFMIRSYAITDDSILIRRLFWTTRLERDGLKSAEVLPGAMKGSIRTCGNGGAFSFTGWYWSRKLGSYRAFVTDLKRTVVLRFDKRTVVVSPDDPEAFAAELARR